MNEVVARVTGEFWVGTKHVTVSALYLLALDPPEISPANLGLAGASTVVVHGG